jgi:hypothetical protein
MFLKRLFYASASILMLAAAYHLGALSAGAQSGGAMEGASVQATPSGLIASFTMNRVLYLSQLTNAGYWWPVPAAPVGGAAIPGTAAVVATAPYAVLLANGDVYTPAYGYGGNLVTGSRPTATRQQTFGALKAKYR